MQIFGVPEAKHYCRNFRRSGGDATGSLGKFVNGALKTGSSLKEGTSEFDSFRDCSLRETERCLFLAISNFRRALDLMMPVASSWAHVTLYYSSYFSARALVGMFGGWIGHKMVVEVAASQPGNQELVTKKIQTTYNGSHDRFWDVFYRALAPLMPWVDPKVRFAITPISGNVAWQTQSRNDINYDSLSACQLAANFQSGFNPGKFPTSLPGSMSTQYSVSEALLLIACRYVREFRLMTDALDLLTPAVPRRAKIERLILRVRAPRLPHGRKWRSMIV